MSSTVKEMNVKELKEWQNSGKDFQLIDVREQHEFDDANMDGELIPLGSIPEHIDKISTEKPVVVHCRSGKRSANAISYLQSNHGFDNLINLEGGIIAWQNDSQS